MNKIKIFFVSAITMTCIFAGACNLLTPHPPLSYIIEAEYSNKGRFITVDIEGAKPVKPLHDAFTVTKVIKGNLNQNCVLAVHPYSSSDLKYPKHMANGRKYTLRFTPGTNTLAKIKEQYNNYEKSYWLVIGKEELELYPSKKK